MREALPILKAVVFQSVCVRAIKFAEYEFVWGVNVLTKGVRISFAVHCHNSSCPKVTHFIQDKEPNCQADLHGGVPRLIGN